MMKNTINFLKNSKKTICYSSHSRNTKTMQRKPNYKNVLLDIYDYFEKK